MPGRGEGTSVLKVAYGVYSFARQGGAVGTIALDGEAGVPSGAVIMGGYVDVTSAALSATGTIAITVESAGDIVAAVGQAGYTVGRKSVIPAFTGATAIKTTAARNISAVIATAAYTAGVFRVVLFYV
jgi:formylmethanofuran dehydrogenase subunit C